MKPICFANTTELASSVKLNTDKYNLIKHVLVSYFFKDKDINDTFITIILNLHNFNFLNG